MDITSNLLIGFVAGILSSVLTLYLDRLNRRRKLARRFKRLEGQYEHYSLTGTKYEHWLTTLRYKGERLLATHSQSDREEWWGHIVMSEDMPGFGSGSYQYTDREDTGLHQIQVDPMRDVVYVHWRNTSHGNKRESTYVWRRVGTTMINSEDTSGSSLEVGSPQSEEAVSGAK
jgi:hypothetical protein